MVQSIYPAQSTPVSMFLGAKDIQMAQKVKTDSARKARWGLRIIKPPSNNTGAGPPQFTRIHRGEIAPWK
jgi:hypothetical protein